jgi:hypothetical protein
MLRRTLVLITALFVAQLANACTSAVVSGRATKDGRPLLWKQRDTDKLENELVYAREGRFAFVGVHDLADSANAECFMGSNETGFSIINTASYNLVYEKYPGKMDEEGKLMRQALGTCRSLEDFEQLLRDTRGKRGVEANFGVIDAFGGAAYYETDPYGFVKFDANDPSVAPEGYLIRTNFSMSGTPQAGYGYIRYQTTSTLFNWAFLEGRLSVDFILLEATTNLRHSLVGTNLAEGLLPLNDGGRTMVPFTDFVPRYSTVGSMIIHGVRKGDDPGATTVWTVLGSPLTTPVVPVWVKHAGMVPRMLIASGGAPPALCARSLELKDRCFPLKTPEGKGYLDLSRVVNQQGTGTVQQLRSVDRKIIDLTRSPVGEGSVESLKPHVLEGFYRQVEHLVQSYYATYGIGMTTNEPGVRKTPH